MTPAILLFISKESATYEYTRRQVESACIRVLGSGKKPAIKVIDIADQPDLAEKYNIEALPTIVVGNRRYVGAPSSDLLSTCMGIRIDDFDDKGQPIVPKTALKRT